MKEKVPKEPQPRYKRTSNGVDPSLISYTPIERFHLEHQGKAGEVTGLPSQDGRDPFAWLDSKGWLYSIGEDAKQLIWHRYREATGGLQPGTAPNLRDKTGVALGAEERLTPEEQRVLDEYAEFLAVHDEQERLAAIEQRESARRVIFDHIAQTGQSIAAIVAADSLSRASHNEREKESV